MVLNVLFRVVPAVLLFLLGWWVLREERLARMLARAARKADKPEDAYYDALALRPRLVQVCYALSGLCVLSLGFLAYNEWRMANAPRPDPTRLLPPHLRAGAQQGYQFSGGGGAQGPQPQIPPAGQQPAAQAQPTQPYGGAASGSPAGQGYGAQSQPYSRGAATAAGGQAQSATPAEQPYSRQ